ncbi:alpha/beta hydrolase [Herbidospora sp. NBRC 101105]|uniref:alpha/beta hydrolase n=1 Tax=Herbidospora sp. NBRC 101105 TaxID=3032195 RepID=UPI0024A0A7F2|nr:esterase [Herbidospora sp. NBRC 101105]
MTPVRPAVDAELRALSADLPLMPELTPEVVATLRAIPSAPLGTLLGGRAVERREVTVAAEDGAEIPLTVLVPPGAVNAPCVVWIHGGGMIMGDRFANLDIPLEWLDRFGAVVVTVDYRLAPDVTGTTLAEDCYRALTWAAGNAAELGVDPARIVVAGVSAGGGLAAGVALMARDRGGPALAAQVLICPMLDHRDATTSTHQFTGPGVWSREMNAYGWLAVLGGLTGDDVPAYVSPAVADDLSGLPPAYVDAGSAEVFRDEDVAYATRIWAAGGRADLHVWDGGFHGFDALYPGAALSQEARRTRTEWLDRLL